MRIGRSVIDPLDFLDLLKPNGGRARRPPAVPNHSRILMAGDAHWKGMARGWSALLMLAAMASAGCLAGAPSDAEPPSSSPPSFGPPLQGERMVDVAALPGLVLAGDAFHEGQHHTLVVAARNEGDRTYWVKAEDCGGRPWHDGMARDGAPVAHRPAEVACDICSWRAFGPGETIRAMFEWDELVWDGSERKDAPPGTYAWSGHLKVREDQGCNEYEPSAKVSLDVQVG
jgi:hypothetical protein